MRRLCPATAALAAVLCVATNCSAQINVPPETRNAALRYWMAMGDLQDPPADKETQELLEKTAAGQTSWNEPKLGPILNANTRAIQEMQRATKLPDCDWGLEYSRGPGASISYLTRARVLARLNTLYGMRLMAKGETQDAVDAWLDGVRFSQDLAKGGTLIFKLVARTALLSDFQAMTDAAEAGSLSRKQKAEIAAAVRLLPPDAFDWSEALGLEEATFEAFVGEIRAAKNAAQAFQEITDEPWPEKYVLPSQKEILAYRSLVVEAQGALRLPPPDARAHLDQLQMRIAQFSPFFQRGIPSTVKINEARAEVETSYASLLKALGS
jgi:hypothetical protein